MPAGTSRELPVGLMFVGERFDNATVLRAASAYEEAVGWDLEEPSPCGRRRTGAPLSSEPGRPRVERALGSLTLQNGCDAAGDTLREVVPALLGVPPRVRREHHVLPVE